ncbi:MAG: RIP metalloprotease RseP [Spirochaetaceae bacterium]|jgi:regulator of sigma E protease|nr:RIP metalloprotease RseP [Spirochaetaceae bacterium]
MIVLKIVLGLIGLGIVVFVHELGHFIAARAVGIDVEAFSIGWGKPIFVKKIGSVEYRLGIFPVGGYCKMAGENEFQEAWENNKKEIPQKKGSFLGARPWQRIIVAVAGPFFNIAFAALVFAFVWGIGFQYETMDNRIVLVHDINNTESMPADKAGLETGDRIVAIDGRKVENYNDIQRLVATNAEKLLRFDIVRNGTHLTLEVEPTLQKETGAGKIGVFYYAEPFIGNIVPGSLAEKSGIRPGDKILKINGKDLPYTAALFNIFKDDEKINGAIDIEYERDGAIVNTSIQIPTDDTRSLGIEWKTMLYHTPHYSLFGAVSKGVSEAYWTLTTTIRSFRLLFRGIDLTQSVSGPARITWMVGEIATEGFGQSFSDGLRALGNFLALISVALGVTNLLPLPVLDGGLILLFLAEILRGKPLNPKMVQVFQTVGIVIIAGLMIFAVTGDILFFTRQ